MRDLARSGMTMIVVTHELGFAREVAHRVVFMDRGAIVEAGSPQQVLGSPQQARSTEFTAAVLTRISPASPRRPSCSCPTPPCPTCSPHPSLPPPPRPDARPA